MRYKVTGHKFEDISNGVLPMYREKITEYIVGDQAHAASVFRANNPGFQIISIYPWG